MSQLGTVSLACLGRLKHAYIIVNPTTGADTIFQRPARGRMAKFKGEVGIQLATHLANQYSIADLVAQAQLASERGINRVWIDDNLRYRNVFIILTAIAAAVPTIDIGTAIMVPYFRNPIDAADAIASISELTNGRELSIGIARGAAGMLPHQVYMEHQLTFMKESVTLLKALLRGEGVAISDYPHVTRQYRFKETARFKLAFPTRCPVKFYHGCVGVKASRIAGEVMDGILIAGSFIPMLRLGRVEHLIEAARQGRSSSPLAPKEFRYGCELNISMNKDRDKAIQAPKVYLSHTLPGIFDALGLTEQLGIKPVTIQALREAHSKGASLEDITHLVSDEDVKKCWIAGTPEECREQLLEVLDRTVKLGFDIISFKLGADYRESIELIGKEIIPALS